MQAFGEQLQSYRHPSIPVRLVMCMKKRPNGNPEILLNWITPHQKWGIHSTYYRQPAHADAVSAGWPIVWMSERRRAKGRHRRQRLG
jgi:nitrate reductase alpha subunit